ncbi:hypothetical protein Acy02nite_30840 [Actinoplanes cyaneus]|uniref:Lipoprotein n=1 Tax=Actinoplanes cyaneus TaxID=52696 RepID=A0A919IKP9_9ACTN|nr:hypothetical protein [Actinoplanes cyaneus]MCW2142396.1 hypothetical protein [Actinoplanes cyaneus]GID65203.1 hypothetical protein Acy02nite_30840 [Actinoplanes cyaneus]
MTRSLVPALLLLAVIAGCADQTAGAPGGSTPQVSGGATTPAAAVFPLDFSRTGGFAGFDDRLHLGADGMMTVSHRGVAGQPVAADPAVISALQQVLSASKLAVASPSKGSAVCADGFRYRLVTPSWTYTADDCSGDHPEFERALDLLMPLLKG